VPLDQLRGLRPCPSREKLMRRAAIQDAALVDAAFYAVMQERSGTHTERVRHE